MLQTRTQPDSVSSSIWFLRKNDLHSFGRRFNPKPVMQGDLIPCQYPAGVRCEKISGAVRVHAVLSCEWACHHVIGARHSQCITSNPRNPFTPPGTKREQFVTQLSAKALCAVGLTTIIAGPDLRRHGPYFPMAVIKALLFANKGRERQGR